MLPPGLLFSEARDAGAGRRRAGNAPRGGSLRITQMRLPLWPPPAGEAIGGFVSSVPAAGKSPDFSGNPAARRFGKSARRLPRPPDQSARGAAGTRRS
jgi:hypothetical protein